MEIDKKKDFNSNNNIFPAHLLIISIIAFCENLEALYFYKILQTLQVQWALPMFSIETMMCLSSLSIYLGGCLCFKILSKNFQKRRILLISSVLQGFLCILISCCDNVISFCLCKCIYGFFEGISMKLSILLVCHSQQNLAYKNIFPLLFLQVFQVLSKMWILTMMLVYETNETPMRVLWIPNVLPHLVFIMGICYFNNEYQEKYIDNQYIPVMQKNFMRWPGFLRLLILVLTLEILSKGTLIFQPFVATELNTTKILCMFTVICDFFGLLLVFLTMIYPCTESQTNKTIHMNYILIFFINLAVIFSYIYNFQCVFLICITRILYPSIKNILFTHIYDCKVGLQILLYFLLIGDLVMIVLPYIFLPLMNISCVLIFSVCMGVAAIGGACGSGVKIYRNNEEKDGVELEMHLIVKNS